MAFVQAVNTLCLPMFQVAFFFVFLIIWCRLMFASARHMLVHLKMSRLELSLVSTGIDRDVRAISEMPRGVQPNDPNHDPMVLSCPI